MSNKIRHVFLLSAIICLYACESKENQSSVNFIMAHELPEKSLIAEGIVVDTATLNIYVTSINEKKIVKISPDGKTSDFITSDQSGFGPGVGIKIDYKKNQLLALSNFNQDSSRNSCLFAFNLETGDRIGNYNITGKHFWNDLIVTSDGFIYITDSDNKAIYEFGPDRRTLVTFLDDERIAHPNGICLSKDENIIYLATWRNGIIHIDRNTREILDLNSSEMINDLALDGIVFYDNSIIGIQNGYQIKSKHRLVQYILNAEGSAIIEENVLDKNNPYFDVPTTVALADNVLYVIANSQLDNFDDELAQVNDTSILKNTFILKYDL